jgi:DNA-binding NarL/FixJ family response regulator
LHIWIFGNGAAIERTEKTVSTVPQVLVVEDFAAYRAFVTSLLKDRADLRVIGEVTDGLQAVELARDLKPDLILLDIGLPGINGIEAARRILKLAPESKIVFLTQETSEDVVHEALNVGAAGYVVKSQAGSELLAAIEIVLRGERFVSHGLNGHESADRERSEAKR